MRRRQRRLRAMLRHERQTVAMELAAALHHSRDAEPGPYHGLRTQKTASSGQRPGVLTEPEPQGGAVTVGYEAAPVPFHSSPMLADTAAGTVDARTVKYLLQAALQKEEEEKERLEAWQLAEALETRAKSMLEQMDKASRKRKKRKKKKLPRSSVPRGARARRRLR